MWMLTTMSTEPSENPWWSMCTGVMTMTLVIIICPVMIVTIANSGTGRASA